MNNVVVVDCLRTPMGRSKGGAFRHRHVPTNWWGADRKAGELSKSTYITTVVRDLAEMRSHDKRKQLVQL